MPNEYTKILKYNHGKKSLKVLAIIYADLEFLPEKMHSCQNNPAKYYTEKKTKHISSDYSLFTNCSLDSAEIVHLIVTKVKTVWKDFVKT